MTETTYSVITATGSFIPEKIVKNSDFLNHTFYTSDGKKMEKEISEIIEKFNQITEIEERRHADEHHNTSDLGYFAAKDLLEKNNIDKEELDYIIVAHNFGDVSKSNLRSEFVPTLAARIKYRLGIANPFTVAYDLPFGCPGWLQGVIQGNYYIKAGDAKKVMVIGSETLSRVSDPHDIDSMLYSDGAGAVLLEAIKSDTETGILTHLTRSDTLVYSQLLSMNTSYNPDFPTNDLFLKMNGRKLYEYALNHVPQFVKDAIQRAGIYISDVKKVLIHQANAKMNQAILSRIFKLFDISDYDPKVMPMTISTLGNNSVATLPILFDLLLHGKLEDQSINSGDYIVFASVGAGMNINVVIYKSP